MNSRIRVSKNDILSFGKINFGVRCYLSVKDGFKTKNVLKSNSFYQNITEDYIIRKNEILLIDKVENRLKSTNTSIKVLKSHFETKEIKCFKGPEYDLLEDHQKEQLINQLFTISNDNNRMGYRLNETIQNNLSSILTSAVLPGTVQLTPSGKLIVLMKDCQVTGGYPRVLQLTEKAIAILSQKTTHNRLKFILISI
jgi:allophanate hydrolase subunit 2